MHRVLVINGAIHGPRGNTHRLLRHALGLGPGEADGIVHLVETPDPRSVLDRIAQADALLVGTGVYWDSCGSPLQRLIEEMTLLEGSPAVLGKPVGFVVSCEVVGGKSVLNRLQGVFSSMGFLVPPMSGAVISRVADAALRSAQVSPPEGFGLMADLWTADDLPIIVQNLRTAMELGRPPWLPWSVQSDAHPAWPLPDPGPVRRTS